LKTFSQYSTQITCKCCGADAHISGLVDFSRCGADASARRKVDPYAGMPVYYYTCIQCGFTFTSAFDNWTHNQWAQHVYNADYQRHDPDYLEKRPQQHADMICNHFSEMCSDRVLDFGSGLGLLEKKLLAREFRDVTSYDPFTHPEAPQGQFDTILSFEVFEHHTDPKRLFKEVLQYRKREGAVLFQTSLINSEIIAHGLDQWWYCTPRNGHISFHSRQSLTLLASEYGLRLHSFNEELHVLFDETAAPAWLSKFFNRV
jgi:hypothetical protein